jgi:hypothetical protein
MNIASVSCRKLSVRAFELTDAWIGGHAHLHTAERISFHPAHSPAHASAHGGTVRPLPHGIISLLGSTPESDARSAATSRLSLVKDPVHTTMLVPHKEIPSPSAISEALTHPGIRGAPPAWHPPKPQPPSKASIQPLSPRARCYCLAVRTLPSADGAACTHARQAAAAAGSAAQAMLASMSFLNSS